MQSDKKQLPTRCQPRLPLVALGCGVLACALQPAHAATSCVNPGGTAGCYSSIGAAVAAATPGTTIQIGPGTYKESVTITQTVLLAGVRDQSIIDATGKATGIFVNGMASAPSPGISGVTISGLTIKNANFEGILVVNATGVTISNNVVYGNNLALMPGTTTTCPGLPAFETNEGDDCGEGIHFMGVDHSILSNNDVENNAGGILITDETGPSAENLITGNRVAENAYDCGITIASHGRAPSLPAGPNYAVYHNTVSGNQALHNGNLGQGAGVGIYAPGPGSTATANLVIGNVLTDNGLGGVTMHVHAAPGVAGVPAGAPGVNLSDNIIMGNQISGNSADVDDPSTPGSTGISIVSVAPVTGTIVAQNTFTSEVADIVFSAPAGTLEAHLNNFGARAIGVDAEGAGYIDASQNWWGCAGGPGTPGCGTTKGSSAFAPAWLPAPFGATRQGRP